MAAKELVLVPKQKYESVIQKQSPVTASVHTQTSMEYQMEENYESECVPSTCEQTEKQVNDGVKPELLIRSRSWNSIPGVRQKPKDTKPRKKIKWIPY